MTQAKYYVEGSEVAYSDCLEYFKLYSGYSKDDAEYEFRVNDNPESCDYINEMCSGVEVTYQ
jgi:hypothetical protein